MRNFLISKKIIADNAEVIKNDVFGFKIYTKLCKNYSILSEDRSRSNPPLSPLISESSSTKTSDKTRAHSKAQSKKSSNSTGNKKHSDNKKNANKNEKKHQHQHQHQHHQHQHQHQHNSRGQQSNNAHNTVSQGHNMNYPMGYPMGQYGHPMPTMSGPMMYGHPMQPSMMAPPGMMHPDYYLQNPQMYNQYYNYPPPSQGHPGLYYGKNH